MDLISGSHLIYKLYGVINHTGSLEFGHYYSYIKLFDSNIWRELNDKKVKELKEFELDLLDSSEAYCLIYIKE